MKQQKSLPNTLHPFYEQKMGKRTRSADSGYESNDDEQFSCSKRTKITTEKWTTRRIILEEKSSVVTKSH